MKLFQESKKEERISSRIALKGGGYSIIITAVVLAILVVVNILASVLPATITKRDISSSNLYSITSNTKVVVTDCSRMLRSTGSYRMTRKTA